MTYKNTFSQISEFHKIVKKKKKKLKEKTFVLHWAKTMNINIKLRFH